MQFLMGLNESYSSVRGQILLMNPLPTVRQAYSSICQEEKQRTIGAFRSTPDSVAMAVRTDQAYRQVNNRSSTPSNRSDRKGGRPHCSHCNEDGHIIDTC